MKFFIWIFTQKNRMQKSIILFISFLSFSAFSQTTKDISNVTRYEYELSAKTSKKNLENISTTVCALDILGDSSIFFDTANYERKKIRKNPKKDLSPEEKGMLGLSFRPVFNWFVVSQGKENRFYSDINEDYKYFVVELKKDIEWVIDSKVNTWNTYSVQQAKTTYGGREWTVLFTQDIPLHSGPYVFNNLPGMVVKAWDSEEHYVFELLSSKKAELDWKVLGLNDHIENDRKRIDKAIRLNNNKTYLQIFDEKGIKIGENGRAGFNIKIGDGKNDIYIL
ncbi:GLPGLI family protein [Myroides odoratimimus]|uniref:GLPGLI family protein n=2 Tax=Myroides odoratimimus TaxID=76832 RepID=A0ABN0EDH1_9FLAO|nr:GLPGLI family protein [Myroides odoratimimus]EHO11943.1 hypothetical protein HMPREF9712_00190 [Myroides odoratimimus CCUG 10230]EHO12993.1 hypothetical protein HMPREF9714_01110 [Myroides odoratimimus CCUG 12901]MCA4792165.1 GLPGLI family protein [Myroides odoratimimus]MCA4819172.1 GLPGLI family protein [Myroides odoratimimus]MDM1058600.1 GLPGLI family protein [Myroides odoratimimus]